jgi:hypothetical protein
MSSKPTRRTFFGQAGAALAAPLAATAAVAGEPDGGTDVAARLAALEDANALRTLQQRYVRLVNARAQAGLAALFAEPSLAMLDASIRHVAPDADDGLEIAADGTATTRVACTVVTATPIESCGTLVEMARLQGDGHVERSDRRVLASSFVKRDGTWQLVKAEFQA